MLFVGSRRVLHKHAHLDAVQINKWEGDIYLDGFETGRVCRFDETQDQPYGGILVLLDVALKSLSVPLQHFQRNPS